MYQACQAAGRKFYYVTLHDDGIGKWAPFAGGTDRDGLTRLESAFGLEFIPGTTDLPNGVSGTLNVRNQVSEISLGGAAGVTGTLSVQINSGIPFIFNAVATSTIDNVGTSLAADIDANANYQATYAGGVIEITHVNSGVAFSAVVDDGGTNITMNSSVITTPAVFVISGTPSVTAGGLPRHIFMISGNRSFLHGWQQHSKWNNPSKS